MTQDAFRKIALSFPDTEERAHMGHPDFRVSGKIFATLWPAQGLGMVKLTPMQQQLFILAEPEGFVPVKGKWGERGCTHVRLGAAGAATVRHALDTAWRNTAPKSLRPIDDDEREARKARKEKSGSLRARRALR